MIAARVDAQGLSFVARDYRASETARTAIRSVELAAVCLL